MLWGHEAGTSPLECTHRTHVAGTVRNLVHTKWILVYFYVVAATICKSSAHDTIIENWGHFVPASWRRRKFKPAEFHASCCGDKILSPRQNVFRKNGHVTPGKLSLQHVPDSCLRNMPSSVCRLVTGNFASILEVDRSPRHSKHHINAGAALFSWVLARFAQAGDAT